MNSVQHTTTGKDEECAPSERHETEVAPASPALASRHKWIILVGMAVIVLVLGGLGGVIGGFIVRATVEDDDDDSPTDVQPGNDITRAELLEFLEQNSLPNGGTTALSDPLSPQSQAFEWLLQDLTSPGALLATEQSKLQRYALATVYYSTNGDGWMRRPENNHEHDYDHESEESEDSWPWLTLDHECEWGGVSCNFDDTITALLLPRTYMSGPIPAEISLLSALASLNLSQNHLPSSIPTELGVLTKLHTLILLENHLTGLIHDEFGQLTRLVELNLAHNKLSGSIPTEFGLLTMIERMDLKDNLLTGDIPSELGMMQHASKCSYLSVLQFVLD